ncbi:MAG: transcriptional regulator [Ectothiorhodospiraceae bacterium]|nr:transcriptional regulator [Ectothiorhodospiraceae bacterium]
MEALLLHTDLQVLERAANMLKAVSHPIRLSIMSLLDDERRMSVTEIHEELGIEQAVASHHLTIMKDRGVLESERDGRHIYYHLKFPKMTQIVDCVQDCCTLQPNA